MSLFSILFTAFLMLQVHNMLPHQHSVKAAKNHAHTHGKHSHHHESKSEDTEKPNGEDHSAEFGKSLIKPGYSKYQQALVKCIPVSNLEFAVVLQRPDVYTLLHKLPPGREFLIPPPPYLEGVNFRGPPSIA